MLCLSMYSYTPGNSYLDYHSLAIAVTIYMATAVYDITY